MKLKHLLPIIFFGATLLSACEDTIDRDHRYTAAASPEIKRAVLVEEYTGTRCINSPNGHVILEKLEEYYNTPENVEQGNGLIVVGIHIPNWGYTTEQGGFITPEAADLTPENVDPPMAQINRNGNILKRDEWSKAIAEQISRPATVHFPDRITAVSAPTGILVNGTVIADENIGDARLHVWLVEDNIKFLQQTPDGNDLNYMHRNVYRAHMTGSYAGDDFALTRNVGRRFGYSYPLDENWNTENMRAVVFIESPSRGVLNATQTKVLIVSEPLRARSCSNKIALLTFNINLNP